MLAPQPKEGTILPITLSCLSYSLTFAVSLFSPPLHLPPGEAVIAISSDAISKVHVPRCFLLSEGSLVSIWLAVSALTWQLGEETKSTLEVNPFITALMKIRGRCLNLIRRCGTRSEQI